MKFFRVLFVTFILISSTSEKTFSAEKNKDFDGKGGREDLSFLKAKNSNFKKGNDALKQALKFKKKKKYEKANIKFEKALKYFVEANNEAPNKIEVLIPLAFTYNEVGDHIMTEIYYKEGLYIEPKNILINKSLGELYLSTNRKALALERLEVLKDCNCQEYINLKNIVNKN
tara:strand:- start:969 stop:1484 length:516 start_codon:yes stop_codon:yes gene_type:complete